MHQGPVRLSQKGLFEDREPGLGSPGLEQPLAEVGGAVSPE